jgi:hypothetical protein
MAVPLDLHSAQQWFAGNRVNRDVDPIAGQQRFSSLGPFQQHDAAALAKLAPTDLPHFFGIIQPIQIEMLNGRLPCRGAVLEKKIERRGGHGLGQAGTARDCPGQHGFAGTKITTECNEGGQRDGATNGFAPMGQRAFV